MADGEANTATGHATRHTPKTHFEKRATAAMEKHLPKPDWSIRQKLALTARMLAGQEHATGLAGQITARGRRPAPCGRPASASDSRKFAPATS